MNEFHQRFKSAKWYNPDTEVIVGGAGGIGSWLTIFLVRNGVKVHVYDFDEVDPSNMAGQAYFTDSIGLKKTEALQDIVKRLTDEDIEQYERYTVGEGKVGPIMCSAFDNIHARKIMFEKWKAQPDRELFIDGRMLIEEGQVFAVRPGDEEAYENFLFDDADVHQLLCSRKATTYSGGMIASLMTAAYNNYMWNKNEGVEVRHVPFLTTYDLSGMYIETSNKKQAVSIFETDITE